ncbi:SIR2 family NAD-dependent protein deacylase [Enterococcus quebecensis]|uniref:SIR2 family NAD-dependent protein deacylase n=1 Tax=Enterococcus quebecensis TaxID=903983 RepID=UPI00091F4204|nr:Sir2 family NAD-dependent protein deacetylase [Enterococcus quebecensis]OJG74938.1 NAD-dependent deacetylase [Enterococcus quebecensis]
MVASKNRIAAFTGAGISTDSGIPDLAGISTILNAEPNFDGGVFGMLNPTFAINNPALFYDLYRKTFFHPDAKPNPCHTFLSELESQKKILGIATMNIDCLHQTSGSKNVYEYWGNVQLNHCTNCKRQYDWTIIKENKVPICETCGSVVIPDFVLRSLATYSTNVQQGTTLLHQADLILIAGTKQSRGSLPSQTSKVIINLEKPYSLDENTLFIQGNTSKVFSDVSKLYKQL